MLVKGDTHMSIEAVLQTALSNGVRDGSADWICSTFCPQKEHSQTR